ncbi:DUF6541 family protein [Arthrobacter sp. 3Tela_A]|uniref:DUF6541 family protein n=1 Tax=Arthrobacter sp. 3Tela_A TaxID=3093743 RepID=UPI003BB79956
MDWLGALPAILIALALLIVPGLAISLTLRLRLFDAVAVAPLVTVTLVSVSAIAAPFAGIAWSILPVLVLTVLVLAACYGITRFSWYPARSAGSAEHSFLRHQGPWFAAAAAAFLLIGWQVVHVIGAPENFSQTFDNNFHLNAVRYILDTGNASSLTLTSMTTADQPAYFYPAAWHGIVSLIVQLSGVPVTAATSAAIIAVSAAVWPLSVLFAVRRLANLAPAAVLGAGIVVGSFSAFPILLLDFGVLYPNVLSLSMVPAALVILAGIMRQVPHPGIPVFTLILLAMLTVPGVAVSHPNGVMTLFALAVPAVVSAYVRGIMSLHRSGASWSRYLLATLAAAAAAGVFLVMWKLIRPPKEAAVWNRVETAPQAFGEALLNAPFGRPAAVVISILVLLGLIYCFRRPRLLWVAGAYLLSIWLFAVAAGYPISDNRMFVTGVWYNDPYRLAAILPIVGAPLAILGLQLILEPADRWVRARLSGAAGPVAAAAPFALGLAVVLVLLPLTQRASMDTAVASARGVYAVTDDSALVSTDELELIRQLPELTEPDAVIAVNPWTGGALAYAIADRDTTYKHTLSNTSPEAAVVDNNLKNADSMPEVCDAVEATGVDYVLDFGTREVHGGDHRYPGIEELDADPDFEKVASVGEASLYKFVGCP